MAGFADCRKRIGRFDSAIRPDLDARQSAAAIRSDNPIIANIRGGIQFGLLAKVVVQAGFRDLDEQVNVTGLRLSGEYLRRTTQARSGSGSV